MNDSEKGLTKVIICIKNNKKIVIIVLSIILVILVSLFFILSHNYYIKTMDNKKDVEVLLGNSYSIPEANIYILGKKTSGKVEVSGMVDTNKVGEYEVVYSYSNGFIKDKYIKKVKVIEKEAPVIYLKGSENVTICPGANYEELGYSAIDNYDGDITDKVEITKHDSEIIYSVSDSSGNKTEVKRYLKESDKESPTIKLLGVKEVINVGDNYNDKDYSATDNCDGNLTNKIKIDGHVDTSHPGYYYLVYTVEDKAGNKSTKTKTVQVVKTKEEKNLIREKLPNRDDDKILGTIYLTFDDGPSKFTKSILDILKKNNIKATFFVTSKGPDSLIKREYDEGHTVALHTSSHNYAKVYASDQSFFDDLELVSKRVEKVTGIKSKYIRFPGGSSNTISRKYSKGIMSRLVKEVHNRGYEYYDWNITSGDAGETKDPERIYKNVINSLSKKRNNMILFHDTKSYTVKALPKIIQYGIEHNYEFKAIDDDAPKIHHSVNN